MDAAARPVRAALRRDAERNRVRIVETARRMVDEQGLRVSHDDIARAAQVGVGTVYRRFPTLDALFDEIFHDRVEVVVEMIRQATEVDDPWEGLRQYMVANCELQSSNRGLQDWLRSPRSLRYAMDAQQRLIPAVALLVERARAARVLRPEIQPSDIPIVFEMIGAIIDAARDVDPDLWRRYLDLLLDGMRADPARSELPGSPPRGSDLDRVLTRGRERGRGHGPR